MSGGWLGNSSNTATRMVLGPKQSVTSSVNCMKWCVQLDMFPHQAWIHEAEQWGQKATERSFLAAAKRNLALANAHVNESPPSGEAWTNAAWMAAQEKGSWELSCPSALGCRSWWQPRRKLEKRKKTQKTVPCFQERNLILSADPWRASPVSLQLVHSTMNRPRTEWISVTKAMGHAGWSWTSK